MKLLMFFLIFRMAFHDQFLKFQSNLSISKNKILFKYTHTHTHTHTHLPYKKYSGYCIEDYLKVYSPLITPEKFVA